VALIVQRANRIGLVKARAILGHGTEESFSFLNKLDYVQHLAPWHLEEAREAGVWKPTWTAIPNFIDTDRFNPEGESLKEQLGIPADGLVVLTAAAIKRNHKRIDYLIDEFAKLREAALNLPVWLVIAGGREQDTESLIEHGKQRLGDRVRFLVRFPRERMPALYRTASVFALCSLKEMMPIALLEATACGVPCLVNRHPVVEWMIGPGGKAVDMSAHGALATALKQFLEDEALRKTVAEKARRHCVENFARDPVVDQIVNYYEFVHSCNHRDVLIPGHFLAGGQSP
jgi:1,2-diacylglycerol 3-alpha-glucosyltransferase